MGEKSREIERQGIEQIREAFCKRFPESIVLHNVILPLRDDDDTSTGEYDCIVLCSSGIFVFEIKAWRKAYLVRRKKQKARDEWELQRRDGVHQKVLDPIAQGAKKAFRLRKLFGHYVQHFVYLADDEVEFSPEVNSFVLKKCELGYLVRFIHTCSFNNGEHMEMQVLEELADKIREKSSHYTMEQHIENVQRRVMLREMREKYRDIIQSREEENAQMQAGGAGEAGGGDGQPLLEGDAAAPDEGSQDEAHGPRQCAGPGF